jgi:hypothetical protein
VSTCDGYPTVAARQIVDWFVMRWPVEVTYEEGRRHLGVETQRHWSDKAIARTTPALLGLFAWITLVAHVLHLSDQPIVVRQSAWYANILFRSGRLLGDTVPFLQPVSYTRGE